MVSGPKNFQMINLIKEKLNGEIEEYPSRIIEIKDDVYIIENPVRKSELVMFLNGSKIKVTYMVENQGMHYFEAEVVDKLRDTPPVIIIRKVSDIQKNQRRSFFRIDACIDVEIRKVDDIITEKTMSSDISAGGMRLFTHQIFRLGDVAELSFKLGNINVEVEAKTVKVWDTTHDGVNISLEFLNVTENEQDAIVKFIFEKQRENLKKGILEK